MIRFSNVYFKYSLNDDFALKNITLKIEQSEFLLIVGDSGSGKTTFLRCINALIPHFYHGTFKGDVIVNGVSTRDKNPSEFASIVGTVIQTPQNQVLMTTVEREIAFPLENAGYSEDIISIRIEEALELCGINNLRHKKISELSGGEIQKVVIAASLVHHPKILVLDEPTSQLDPKSAEDILTILKHLNEELGMTVILAEHRLDRILHMVDRVIVFDKGKVVADGEPRMVFSKTDMNMLGVGYPPVMEIALKGGIKPPPLTVKEARKYLKNLLLNSKIREQTLRTGTELLKLQDVWFRYTQKWILKNVNLSLKNGEIIGILGHNGAGKTTLAKLIAGLYNPQKGRVLRRRNIRVGMVFSNPEIHFSQDSVEDELKLSLKLTGVKKDYSKILQFLNIEHLAKRDPHDLSGGEKMLTAIASLAVSEPDILILDEPTLGLSYKHKSTLIEFLKRYAKNRSIIIISHDVETVAKIAPRILLLSYGTVIADANARDIMCGSFVFSTQLNRVAQSLVNEGVDPRILTDNDIELSGAYDKSSLNGKEGRII